MELYQYSIIFLWLTTAAAAAVTNQCGGNITSSAGRFESPNYPRKYSVNTDCVWYIGNGQSTVLYIYYEIEPSRKCRHDYLEVHEDDFLTETLCGGGKTTYYADDFKLVFHSDKDVTRKGFLIIFRPLCGRTITNSTGFFSSPGFPNNYGNRQNCLWTIKPGVEVELSFNYVIEEGGPGCINDFLEVLDLSGFVLDRFCGSGTRTVRGDFLKVFLVTDHSISDGWFTVSISEYIQTSSITSTATTTLTTTTPTTTTPTTTTPTTTTPTTPTPTTTTPTTTTPTTTTPTTTTPTTTTPTTTTPTTTTPTTTTPTTTTPTTTTPTTTTPTTTTPTTTTPTTTTPTTTTPTTTTPTTTTPTTTTPTTTTPTTTTPTTTTPTTTTPTTTTPTTTTPTTTTPTTTTPTTTTPTTTTPTTTTPTTTTTTPTTTTPTTTTTTTTTPTTTTTTTTTPTTTTPTTTTPTTTTPTTTTPTTTTPTTTTPTTTTPTTTTPTTTTPTTTTPPTTTPPTTTPTTTTPATTTPATTTPTTTTVSSFVDVPGIIYNINVIRRGIDAQNILKMNWDVDLQAMAQSWADKCSLTKAYIEVLNSAALPGVNIEQNIAIGYASWNETIDFWSRGQNNYTYGSDYSASVNDYVQMIYWSASRIGCGHRNCFGTNFHICNFAYGVSNAGRSAPYIPGSNAGCSIITDGLCNCFDKFCFNQGTIIVNNCTCSCVGSHTGLSCTDAVQVCAAGDELLCSHLSKTYCKLPVIPVYCPKLCGVCL